MRKLLFTVIVLLLFAGALYAGSTYWFGMRAEQQYHDTLERASQYGYIQFANESYNRGFLQSEARTTVRIPNVGGESRVGGIDPGEDLASLTLIHVIRHGPLPFWTSPEGQCQLKPVMAIIETRIETSPETKRELKEVFDELPEMVSMKNYTILSLTGNGETRLVIPPLQKTVGKKEKVAVIWEGLTGNLTFTADLREFKGALSAPGLEVAGDDGGFRFTNLESAFDIHEDIHGLFLGGGTFDMAHLEVEERGDAEETRFSMDGLKMKTTSQAATDTVGYAMNTQVAKVMVNDTPYGPGNFELEVRKLDAAALARLQKEMRELQTEFSRRSPEEMNQMMLAKYAEILPELLKASPEIEVTELKFRTGDGDFLGGAKVAVDGSNAAALMNPLLLLTALTAHVEFTVTDRLLEEFLKSIYEKEVIEATEQKGQRTLSEAEAKGLAAAKARRKLRTLIEKNVVVHEEGNYRASADYRAGMVTLNGRPVTLQDLQGLN